MALETLSSNDVKHRWGSVMGAVNDPDDAVIVQSHGKPKVAVISYDRFEKLQELEDKARRAWALEQLRQLEQRIGARNSDLSAEQIEELAVATGREINRAAYERWLTETTSDHVRHE